MASTAQIEANRRNSMRSTGPKSDKGKSRVSRNASKHGMAAITIMPVLPQEDPGELEKRIQDWDTDLQPQTAAERELVQEAVRLSYAIERGERMETAHMSRRVRRARRDRLLEIDSQRQHLRELERRLLYVVGPEEVHIDKQPPWTDDPWLLVRELEEHAEGCRWLIERWEEYRNLLDYISKWDEAVMIRFIRLQGKDLVEAVFDPKLNAIFLAWDVLVPKYAAAEWESYRKDKPITMPSHNHRLRWHEITERPKDAGEALEILYGTIDQHVERLKELLTRNEALEAAEAEEPDWADFAALDCSPEFERHRRGQSARLRELHRTLDTLLKMRNAEVGMRNEEQAGGNCQMADDKCQGEQYEVHAGGCDDGQSSEPMTEESSVPIVGYDSKRVLDDSANDKIGILSHQDAQPGEGAGAGQCLHDDLAMPQKAPNKANLESEQILGSQALKSETTEQDGQEQTQSREAVASEIGVAGGEWRVASEDGAAVNPKSAIQNPKSEKAPWCR
jgi:hypothetical protein